MQKHKCCHLTVTLDCLSLSIGTAVLFMNPLVKEWWLQGLFIFLPGHLIFRSWICTYLRPKRHSVHITLTETRSSFALDCTQCLLLTRNPPRFDLFTVQYSLFSLQAAKQYFDIAELKKRLLLSKKTDILPHSTLNTMKFASIHTALLVLGSCAPLFNTVRSNA